LLNQVRQSSRHVLTKETQSLTVLVYLSNKPSPPRLEREMQRERGEKERQRERRERVKGRRTE
jgi:hypothetical protein